MWRKLARPAFLAASSVTGGCSLVVSTAGLAGTADTTSDAAADARAEDVAERVDAPIESPPVDGGKDVDVDADASDGRVVWAGNGHRYEVRVYASQRSWTDARDDAAQSGGHLVTITSAAEGAFVASLVGSRIDAYEGAYGPWIGAYQPNPTADDGGDEPAGGWAWVTGEAWSYTAWGDGEPNNAGNAEHYGHYFDVRWNDIALSGDEQIRSAVIEYE